MERPRASVDQIVYAREPTTQTRYWTVLPHITRGSRAFYLLERGWLPGHLRVPMLAHTMDLFNALQQGRTATCICCDATSEYPRTRHAFSTVDLRSLSRMKDGWTGRS